MKQFRQGDVFVQQVRRPVSLGQQVPPEKGRVVLAYGEVTGHAHTVVADDEVADIPAAQLFQAPTGERYLLVERPCSLMHEEHGPIALTPGAYRVVIQREYVAPEISRQVAD